ALVLIRHRRKCWTSNRSRTGSRPSEGSWTLSGGIFDVDGALKRVAAIDQLAAAPDFWTDQQRAQGLLREQSQKRSAAESWEKQKRALDDAQVLLELAAEAGD